MSNGPRQVNRADRGGTVLTLHGGAHPPHGLLHLPAPATGFIGRDNVIKAILRLLQQPHTRLLTLTGAPGIGKTRLAIEIGRVVADTFPDGVCFVPLAETTHADTMVAAIAQALGLQEQGDLSPQAHLVAFLRDKQLLLILDNLEQIRAPARTLGALLEAGLGVKILATSRSLVQVYGEHEFRVPPLAVPDTDPVPSLPALAQIEAVALFVQRAQAINADFTLSAENAEAVVELCRRLDGLPLAIELAAARSRLFPPAVLRARLMHRLDLLTHGPLDLPARQQTLRGAIDWSYDLLSADEQRLFRALAVFAGGCALPDIEAVYDDTPAHGGDSGALDISTLVESLVSQSLVMQVTQPDGGPRFRMLEIIREYAMERLIAEGELEQTRQRHAIHFLARVAEVPTGRGSGGRWIRLGILEREQDNLRAALDYCAEATDPKYIVVGARLVDEMLSLWYARGPLAEAHARLDAFRRKMDSTQMPLAEQDRKVLAGLLLGLGTVETFLSMDGVGRGYLERSLEIYRALDDRQSIAYNLAALAHAALHLGDLDLATTCQAERFALLTELGDTTAVMQSLAAQAEVALCSGDIEQASNLHAQAEEHVRQIDDYMRQISMLTMRSYIDATRGQYQQAAEAACRVLELVRDWEPSTVAGYAIGGLGKIAYGRGRHEQAVVFFAAAQAIMERFGLRLEPPTHAAPTEYEHAVSHLRELLGDAAFEAAWTKGRRQTPQQIHALACSDQADAPVKTRHTAGNAVSADDHPQLTPRELEVLRLVAAGLTNNEVAARLTVTAHTVNMHLRSIYGKLGVSTRAAAVRYAVANHLL